ncbi:rRNA pseudouridine synthase, partial [Microvirga sp. 3-52]|nr:rRNA pseudouridine synthase [Microvirga sp. 3-52]
MRINKYLSSAGIVSRRGADKWIEDGRITINGQPAELGSRVNEGDVVLADGKPVKTEEQLV